jgi:glycosyltransferase involved in cell wall biosynthesis
MVIVISNPYSVLLHTQIRQRGFTVWEYKRGIREWFSHLGETGIIHLHWIEYLFISRKYKWLTPLKSFLYISFLVFVKYILRKIIVITLHNLVPHESQYPTLEHRMFTLTLKLADGVIAHNTYSKKMACRMYNTDENKIRVIPHGNFSSYYTNNIPKQKARDILKIPENKFVILLFGLIRPYKGIEELLDILETLLVDEKDLFIVVGGKCEDAIIAKRLKEFSNKFAQSSLVRTVLIPNEDVQTLINASDVGVLPYRDITTSGVLLLYMSLRKPIIVADLEPMKELLQGSGIYYKYGDSEDLAKVILQTKNGTYNLEILSQEVFQISQKYQWDDIADKTVSSTMTYFQNHQNNLRNAISLFGVSR